MERHSVPQNLMDVEFKLFGALTIRQFAYLAAGCLIGVMVYYSSLPEILRLIFVGISVGGGLILSLAKINGQASTVWLANFILSMIVPQERLWRKTPIVPDVLKDDTSLKLKTDKDLVRILSLPSRLGSRIVNDSDKVKVESPVDIEEDKQLQKIDEHFDFLFDTLPKIASGGKKNTSNGLFSKTKTEINPEDNPLVKSQDNLAQTINPKEDSSTAVYTGSNYVATMKPIVTNVNRPIQTEAPKITQTSNTIDKSINEYVAVSANTNNDNKILEKNFKIDNNNYIKGIIQNKSLQPIVGAKVDFIDKNNKLIKTVKTDSMGVFATESPIESGQYYVYVTSEGY